MRVSNTSKTSFPEKVRMCSKQNTFEHLGVSAVGLWTSFVWQTWHMVFHVFFLKSYANSTLHPNDLMTCRSKHRSLQNVSCRLFGFLFESLKAAKSKRFNWELDKRLIIVHQNTQILLNSPRPPRCRRFLDSASGGRPFWPLGEACSPNGRTPHML